MRNLSLKLWVERIDGEDFRSSESGARCNVLDLGVVIGRPIHIHAPIDSLGIEVGNFGWNMRVVSKPITPDTYKSEAAVKRAVSRMLRHRGLRIHSWGDEQPAHYRYHLR